MKNHLTGTIWTLLSIALAPFGLYAGESIVLGPDLKIPPHYKAGSGTCSPGRGYSFTAEAPHHPSTYPKVNLRVFNSEVMDSRLRFPLKTAGSPGTIRRKENRLPMIGVFPITRRRSISKKVQRRKSARLRKALTEIEQKNNRMRRDIWIC